MGRWAQEVKIQTYLTTWDIIMKKRIVILRNANPFCSNCGYNTICCATVEKNLVPTWPLEVSGVTQEPQWACCTLLYSAFVKNNYETDKYRLPHNYSSHQNRNTDLHHISQCWNTHQSQDIYIYRTLYGILQTPSSRANQGRVLRSRSSYWFTWSGAKSTISTISTI